MPPGRLPGVDMPASDRWIGYARTSAPARLTRAGASRYLSVYYLAGPTSRSLSGAIAAAPGEPGRVPHQTPEPGLLPATA
jgi:hypothetical protein